MTVLDLIQKFKNLSCLDLQSNNIWPEDMVKIFNVEKMMLHLEDIRLGDNWLGEGEGSNDDAHESHKENMKISIVRYPRLKTLNLSRNKINFSEETKVGWAISQVLTIYKDILREFIVE